jgi:hypothetical protein
MPASESYPLGVAAETASVAWHWSNNSQNWRGSAATGRGPCSSLSRVHEGLPRRGSSDSTHACPRGGPRIAGRP